MVHARGAQLVLADVWTPVFRLSAKLLTMLFETPVYFVFLGLVVILYWRLNWRTQNALLLAASYFFYGWWDWRFLLLMIASTVIDYAIAKRIEDVSSSSSRKSLLIASLAINFSILGFFKYFNFFLDSASRMLGAAGFTGLPHSFLAIVLPPGISFYTFQEVAYIVDVYHGRVKASRNFVDYGLFIGLFPHLIAGPIQRPSHLLPQVQAPRAFDPIAFRDGCMLILSGLVRKVVIADSCALLANAAFNGKLGSSGWSTLIGVYAFAWQIYGDFSGYSDLARGSAQLLGFHFMVNFRQPYLATSLQDFWHRWHISLSTWLRDYLYIPLGGNRLGEAKTYRNLMITMLLGGLWHGANWTFVVWGAIHGLGLSIERLIFGSLRNYAEPHGWSKWLSRLITFHLVCLTWVFFRAETLGSAIAMLKHLPDLRWTPDFGWAWVFLGILVALGLCMDVLIDSEGSEYAFQHRSPVLRFGVVVAAIALVILFAGENGRAFIYFQF